MHFRFFFHVVGNDNSTSAWFDKWHDNGPLDSVITRRDIYRGGFEANSKVHDLIYDNMWVWPKNWLAKYPILRSFNPIVLIECDDKLWWKDLGGEII